MKQEREYLQLKFEELPVPNHQATRDWHTLEKALNVAMPVGVLSVFLLHSKAWLAKKMLWLYLLGIGATSSAVVVVYQQQQSKPDAARPVSEKAISAGKDTIARKRTTVPVLQKDTVIKKKKTTKPALTKNVILRKQKTVLPVEPKDTIVRKQKTAPAKIISDTIVRKKTTPPYAPKPQRPYGPKVRPAPTYNKLPPPYAPKDTLARKAKVWPPKRVDTISRKLLQKQ